MIQCYEKRYPFGFSKEELVSRLTFFEKADEDFDPLCLRNNYWELIKLDFEETVKHEFNK